MKEKERIKKIMLPCLAASYRVDHNALGKGRQKKLENSSCRKSWRILHVYFSLLDG